MFIHSLCTANFPIWRHSLNSLKLFPFLMVWCCQYTNYTCIVQVYLLGIDHHSNKICSCKWNLLSDPNTFLRLDIRQECTRSHLKGTPLDFVGLCVSLINQLKQKIYRSKIQSAGSIAQKKSNKKYWIFNQCSFEVSKPRSTRMHWLK